VGPSASIGHGTVAPDHLARTGARSGHRQGMKKSKVACVWGRWSIAAGRTAHARSGRLDARPHALQHRPLSCARAQRRPLQATGQPRPHPVPVTYAGKAFVCSCNASFQHSGFDREPQVFEYKIHTNVKFTRFSKNRFILVSFSQNLFDRPGP
jgi:hypothetical protein